MDCGDPSTPAQQPAGALRTLLALGLVTAVPLYVAGSAAVALRGGWRPDRPGEVVIGVAGAGLLLGVAAALWPAGRRWLGRRLGQLGWLAAVLLLGWVAVERYIASTHPPLHGRPPDLELVLEPAPGLLPGVRDPAYFRTNSDGVRAPKLPPRAEAARVLCVGGSTTECLYLDDTEAWPALLADRLGSAPVWVGNSGIGGAPSTLHLRFLEEGRLPGEVDVIVLLVGINDLMASLTQRGRHAPPPRWSQSYLLRRLRRNRAGITAEDAGATQYPVRRQRRAAAELRDELPDLTEDLAAYAERLRALVTTARARGAQPVLVRQPTLWRPDLAPEALELLWFGALPDSRYQSLEGLIEGMRLYNEQLERVAAELDVPLVDTRSLDGRLELFYDDCHFNEAGSRELAELVAQVVRKLLPPSQP